MELGLISSIIRVSIYGSSKVSELWHSRSHEFEVEKTVLVCVKPTRSDSIVVWIIQWLLLLLC